MQFLDTSAPHTLVEPLMPVMHTVRIVIADEHPIFRDGLRRLLETAPGVQIVGEAGSPLEAAVLVRERHPDILLLTLTSAVSVSLDELESLAAVGVPLRPILFTTS